MHDLLLSIWDTVDPRMDCDVPWHIGRTERIWPLHPLPGRAPPLSRA
jgi:hypothetical protein